MEEINGPLSVGLYGEVFLAVKQLATTFAHPYLKIHHGPRPKEGELNMALAGGRPMRTFLDLGTVHEVTILLNGKDADAERLIGAMSNIHQQLSKLKIEELPQAETWNIMSIVTWAVPHYVNFDPSLRQWLYASAFHVRFDTI